MGRARLIVNFGDAKHGVIGLEIARATIQAIRSFQLNTLSMSRRLVLSWLGWFGSSCWEVLLFDMTRL